MVGGTNCNSGWKNGLELPRIQSIQILDDDLSLGMFLGRYLLEGRFSADMGQFLFYYQRPEPATWVYMSSFLIVGVFFMFHRFWSVRNLDVLLLLLLTPGLMLIHESYRVRTDTKQNERDVSQVLKNVNVGRDPLVRDVQDKTLGQDPTGADVSGTVADNKVSLPEQPERWPPRKIRLFGYIWLLSVCGLWLIRMLVDTTFFRRPALDPNLSQGGLLFIGVSLFTFLLANVLNSPPASLRATQINRGPGFDPLKALPDIATTAQALEVTTDELKDTSKSVATMKQARLATTSRALLMVANSILVLGLLGVGYWHFSDLKSGVGAAVLYLLLPYTAQMIGRVEHAIPGALMVLAVLLYRRPLLSGGALGLAGGLVFYPLFLLPLWLSFYWQRGQRRFVAGVLLSLLGLVIALASVYQRDFLAQLRQMFGTIEFALQDLDGIWGLGVHPYVRIPVVVAFVALAFSFAFWPAQKSLATLLNCSAAVMVGAQFCFAYGGGLLMAWYLPLVLLTVFRPNLDDLVASQAVRKFRWSRRKEPPLRSAELTSPQL